MGTRLFIGNLSYAVTEQELREAFTGDGIELRSVRVALDRETGRPRGFAFVETMTDDGAKASIEKLSGRVLQGRAIIVEEAQAKPAGPRPGGFGGAPRPGGFGGPPPGWPGGGPAGPRVAPVVPVARWPPARRLRRPAPSGRRRTARRLRTPARSGRLPAPARGRRRPRPGRAAARRARAAREEEVDAAEARGAGAWQLAVGPQPRRRVARPERSGDSVGARRRGVR